jgi:ferredoxin-type protein NapF
VDPARRRFLRGGFLTAGGRAVELPLGPLPPVTALQVDGYTGCLACDHPCVGACTERVLAVHPAGHRWAGVPYLTFEHGGCTFCHACAEACPLPVPVGLPAGADTVGRAVLATDACAMWNGIVCATCVFACSEGAISRDGQGRPSVQPVRCSGCGACVPVCPSKALSVTPLRIEA